MEYGYYSDEKIPKDEYKDYKTNSYGYRCPEFFPLPTGKKNVVVLGCSHTFGIGHAENTHWFHFVSQHNTKMLRWWNLGRPGVSADKIVRVLYGTEKVLFPKIIVICWPVWSRRERLHEYAQSLKSDDSLLKNENNETDKHNFLKNVFFVQKFADHNHAKVFHCFAQDIYKLEGNNVFDETSLKFCWPPWDKIKSHKTNRERITEPNLAKDGIHYGIEHHKLFAELFLKKFGNNLK